MNHPCANTSATPTHCSIRIDCSVAFQPTARRQSGFRTINNTAPGVTPHQSQASIR